MKRMPRRGRRSQPEVVSARPASDTEAAALLTSVRSDARDDLRALIVRSGLDVFRVMLENDRSALCGPRSQPSDDRTAYRHGHDRAELVFGGQKVVVKKPQVGSVDGQSEVPLPLWERMSRLYLPGDWVMEQMSVGVSTRNYQRSLEPVPSSLRARGATRSAVSRHFVARTQAQVESFLLRRLDDESYPVLMLNGKGFGEHLLIVVLGIPADGTSPAHVTMKLIGAPPRAFLKNEMLVGAFR